LAYDARYISREPSGIGQMALELLRGLADSGDDFFLKVLVNDRTHLPQDLWDRENLLFCEAPWEPRGVANQLLLPARLRRWRIKVLHSVDCFHPLAALDVAHLVNLHDVIPLVCPQQLARSRKVRWAFAWKTWLRLQCARASQLVTVSHYSAGDVCRHLRISAKKIHVIHNPVREWSIVEPVAEFRRRLGLHGRVISTVGRQEPYKNLLTLVRAMRLVVNALEEPLLRLVVAGSPNALYPEAQEEVHRLGLADRVLFAGYLPEATLGALYQASDLFVFPSLYEGFGLPPVEAMQFGVPVVAAHRTALPEVLGDAACYVDMDDPQALASSILELLRDPVLARRYRAAGIEQAARYSPGKAAAHYRRLYDVLLRRAGVRCKQTMASPER
jgi:glycosyltransferase involved in cell wall biosynthesis